MSSPTDYEESDSDVGNCCSPYPTTSQNGTNARIANLSAKNNDVIHSVSNCTPQNGSELEELGASAAPSHVSGVVPLSGKEYVETEDEFDRFWLQVAQDYKNAILDPENITVAKATKYNQGKYHAYQMMSKPRGFACIVNNTSFRGDHEAERTGAETDALCLLNLFEALGFNVCMHSNVTKDELTNEKTGILTNFLAQFENSNVDCCMFALMSHGQDGGLVRSVDHPDPKNIMANHWDIEADIISRFNNRKCPALRGKPRIFFIQACRGKENDLGVYSKLKTDFKSYSNASERAWQEPPEADRRPTYDDTLVCYSTVPGFVSNRDPHRGTWYIESLTKVFMVCAHNTEIMEMLKRVNRLMRILESECGWKQCSSFSNHGFNYDLYFNPGLYGDPDSSQ